MASARGRSPWPGRRRQGAFRHSGWPPEEWGGQCATDRNQLALLYNRKLAQEMAKLAGSFHGVNLVYIDLYAILADIVHTALSSSR